MRAPYCCARQSTLRLCRPLKRGFGSADEYIVTGTIPKHGQAVVIGQYAEVERIFSDNDIMEYGRLVGDMNPLHHSWQRGMEPDVVKTSPLVRWHDLDDSTGDAPKEHSSMVLAHGMLVASLFTCIFGTLIPGSIYLNQSLDFRKPVYAGDLVRGRITVTSIRQWKRRGIVLTCNTTVTGKKNLEHIKGHADVWLVNGTAK